MSLGLKSKRTVVQGTFEGEKSETEDDARKHALTYSHKDDYDEMIKEIESESVVLSQIHPSLVYRLILNQCQIHSLNLS